jgi:hypothetical protein
MSFPFPVPAAIDSALYRYANNGGIVRALYFIINNYGGPSGGGGGRGNVS